MFLGENWVLSWIQVFRLQNYDKTTSNIVENELSQINIKEIKDKPVWNCLNSRTFDMQIIDNVFRAISLSRKKLSNVECIWINLEHHLGDAAKVKKIRNINIRSQVKKRCTIFFPIITPLVAESRMINKDVSFKVIQELW